MTRCRRQSKTQVVGQSKKGRKVVVSENLSTSPNNIIDVRFSGVVSTLTMPRSTTSKAGVVRACVWRDLSAVDP